MVAWASRYGMGSVGPAVAYPEYSITVGHGAVALQVDARGDAAEDLRDATRSAELFEKEFHVKLYFRQSMA